MSKKMKRWLNLMLVCAMTASLLAGCGGSSQGNESSSQSGSQEGGSAESESDGRQKFTIALVRYTDAWPTDFLESGFLKELEEKHNIDIEWQVYYMSDWAEQKSLLLASGEDHLPDAFLGSVTLENTDIAQNKSYFIELTDLIEKNMPNLTAVFESDPELRAIATDRDGLIYSLPKRLPLRPEVCGNVAFINQKWLDNLGLQTPKTYLELEEVLTKFIEEDADGDGDPTNEIGLTGYANSTALSNDLRNILSPFGTMVSRADNYMGLNGNGDPVFMPIQDNYKQAVAWMHGLYEKGIIDPEYFTQESGSATAKKQASGGSAVGLVFGWTADAEVGGNVADFALLEAVEGYDGNHYVEFASEMLDISDRELLITTKCSDPDKLLQWADDFYTDLGSLQTYYGSIPDYISDNGDGTYSLIVPSDGSSLDTSAWSNSFRDHGMKYMNPDFYDKVILPSDQGDGVKLSQDEVNAKYKTEGRNTGLPQVKYTQEELQRKTTLGTDIYQYVEAQYAHWVVDGGVEDEWDAYIDRLNAMGLEELIQIEENAYSFYLESLGK